MFPADSWLLIAVARSQFSVLMMITNVNYSSVLCDISQGPTGKPGLPGMPGADGPPVRLFLHHLSYRDSDHSYIPYLLSFRAGQHHNERL